MTPLPISLGRATQNALGMFRCRELPGKAHPAGAHVPGSFCLYHGLICNPIFGSAVAQTGYGTAWTMEGRNIPGGPATVVGYGFYWLSGMIMSEPAAHRQCLPCRVSPRVRVRIRQREKGFNDERSSGPKTHSGTGLNFGPSARDCYAFGLIASIVAETT